MSQPRPADPFFPLLWGFPSSKSWDTHIASLYGSLGLEDMVRAWSVAGKHYLYVLSTSGLGATEGAQRIGGCCGSQGLTVWEPGLRGRRQGLFPRTGELGAGAAGAGLRGTHAGRQEGQHRAAGFPIVADLVRNWGEPPRGDQGAGKE